MSTPESDADLFMDLDMGADEAPAEPAPEPEAPAAEPVEPAEPPKAERPRDPATGQFLPQPPANMPDPVKAAEPEPQKPQVVPIAALLEERRRWQQQIDERDRRLQEVEQRIAKVETPPAPAPDFVEDPKAYIDTEVGKLREQVKPLEQQSQVLTQQQQLDGFLRYVGGIESEFVQRQPDYYDALSHIRHARTEQLLTLFPQATPAQIQQQLQNEEIQASIALVQQGRNPSEAVYEMAKKTYGYQRKAAEPAPTPAPARPNVPQAPVADPSSTLGSGGGAGEEPDLDSTDEEYAEFTTALKERFNRR